MPIKVMPDVNKTLYAGDNVCKEKNTPMELFEKKLVLSLMRTLHTGITCTKSGISSWSASSLVSLF